MCDENKHFTVKEFNSINCYMYIHVFTCKTVTTN